MNVYIFGNKDIPEDYIPDDILAKLHSDINDDISFIRINENEDLPLNGDLCLYMIDKAKGIRDSKILTEKDIDKIKLVSASSVHDFDLAFQLKYLIKIGRLKKLRLLAIPYGNIVNYSSIHSMVKKLVAQDIQGS